VPAGVYRRVFLVGGIAIKVPRLSQLLAGMRCNRWEREMWRTWRPFFRWNTLCPVLFADPVGVLVIMPRAQQPVDNAEVEGLPDAYPTITSESKAEDFDRLGGRVVALDYGIPYAAWVSERRLYFQDFATSARPHFNGEKDA
jgi:hypothetical protein